MEGYCVSRLCVVTVVDNIVVVATDVSIIIEEGTEKQEEGRMVDVRQRKVANNINRLSFPWNVKGRNIQRKRRTMHLS